MRKGGRSCPNGAGGFPAVFFWLLAGILFSLLPKSVPAATPPGTRITNIAAIAYQSSEPVTRISSNQTAVTVDGFYAVSIDPPWSGSIYPGTSADIRHTVTNAGNVIDTIDLEGTSSLGFSMEFLAADGQTPLGDSNGDGRPDTGPLPPGGSIEVVIRLTVPAGTGTGQIDNTTITAVSATSPSASGTVSNQVLIPNFWDPLVKTVDPAGQVSPGITVTYTNTFGNSGGAPATNVVITDELDVNLVYIDGSATSPPGIAGTVIAYDNTTRTVTWTIPTIPAGYSGQVSFRALVDPGPFPVVTVNNQISMVSDQSPAPQYSNVVSTLVMDQPLYITKTADRKVAEIGDYVGYTVTVENRSGVLAADNVVVSDDLPQGFRYVHGSSRQDGAAAADPTEGTRPQWAIGSLAPGESRTLTYRAIVSVDAMLGDGVNTAIVAGTTPGGNLLRGGPAKVRVKVEEGALNSKTVILGRVFVDRDGNRMPGENEPGVKNIRLYLEDGTFVLTDGEGKFSIYGVRAGEHVLKLDRNSLPRGYVPVPLSNAFAGDGGSQFISVPFGGPARGDFGLVPENGVEIPLPESKEKPAGKVYTFGTASSAPPPPLEVQVQYMDPTPEILSPSAGAVLKKPIANIAVRVPEEARHFLKVNGAVIPQERIGKRIHESARKLIVFEYIGVRLSPGPNTIVLESIVPGEEGVAKEIAVTAPGEPEKIVLDPPKATVTADGKSTVNFLAALRDSWNRPTAEDAVVTVVAAKGTIVENDLDPASPGHQIKVKGGQAKFTLRSPLETGTEKIKVLFGNELEAEAEISFTPELRDWVVAGVGSLTVGGRSVSGDTEKIKDDEDYEKGFFHKERLAVFAKGTVFDKYLLTGAYDTGKPEEDGLFQRSAPEKYYPIYGDASTIGYDAESRQKLYLKVERDRSSLMFGDYHTGLSENEFARYDRTFNGFKADIAAGPLTLRGFAAETNQVLVKDEIPGNGTSGFYLLSKPPVIENSERVRIEVRDRFHPERVLSAVEKAPFTDYSLDPLGGTLLFKEPVPSLDAGLNPVWIVVLYETPGEGEKRYTYGGRAGVKLGGKLTVGATAVVEEQGISDATLFGADATLKLSEAFQLKGEVAASDTPEKGKGTAWKVELASDLGKKGKVGAYFREVEETFLNPSMTGSEAGTTKYGVKAAYRPWEKTSLAAESFVQENQANDSKQFVTTLGVAQKFFQATVEAGYRYLSEEQSGPDQKEITSQAAYAGVSGNITKKLGAALKHEQVFTSDESTEYPTKTTAELNYRITETLKGRLAHEFQAGGEKRNATVLGLESRVTKNTTLSSRYQIEDTISGERAQAVIGLNNKWEPRKGLTLNTRAERIQFMDGEDDGSGGTALAFAAEYLRSEKFKGTGRYELRLGEHETTNLFSLGAAVEMAEGLSLLPKVSLWESDKDQGKNSLYDALVGLAYRPKGEPSIQLLHSFRFKLEQASGGGTETEKKSVISSTELSHRISPKWLLTGKYAGKYAWESLDGENFTSYTDLILAGATYDLTDRWDVGVQGKLMNQYDTGMHSLGAVVKTGYRVYRNLYAGLGYNFSRMNDADLAGSSYQSHGPFLELKVKFDEDSLKRPERTTAALPPPADNVVVRRENVDPSVGILGSVEMPALLVNGKAVPLPGVDVTMQTGSPDDVLTIHGDRLGEPIRFQVDLAPAGVPREWKLHVMNAQERVVRTLAGAGSPPPAILWDGLTGEGTLVDNGELYRFQMEVDYADGSMSRSARRIFGVSRTSAISFSLTGSAFAFNSAVLSPAAKKVLKQAAETMRKFPAEKVVVEGHTDGIGSEKYNLALSKRRAEAAMAFLVGEEKIPADRFTVRWYGKSRPIASNDTPEGREINRRVEVKGEISETTGVEVRDQYRTTPAVTINRSSVDVDGLGRFLTTISGRPETIELDLQNAEGRSIRTSVPLPSVEILEPAGVVRVACGSSGETYRANPLPERGTWAPEDVVATYRMKGRTEPGNTVLLHGNPLRVEPDGTFSEMIELRKGENIVGVVVQNGEGGTRIAHLKVSVSTEEGSPRARRERKIPSPATGKADRFGGQAKGEAYR